MTTRTREIENKIAEIQGCLLGAYHAHNSGFIADQIKDLTKMQITYADFDNYAEKAAEIKQDILDKLKLLLKKTLENEKPYNLDDIKDIVQVLPARTFHDRSSCVFYYIQKEPKKCQFMSLNVKTARK